MKTWETSDLYLAAFLVARGFELVTSERQGEGWRVVFVFRDDAHLAVVRQTWLTPDGMVVGHRFANAIKDLKGLVHR